jgi:hypothetical protein
MHETASSVINEWSNFYVITGSSAAALTGLMFVVITLMADNASGTSDEGIATFSTPTVVHFCAALLVSAILSAPWPSLVHPAVLLGLAGLFGTAYVFHVIARTRRFIVYRPGIEDWFWYTMLPLIAYLAIVAGAMLLPSIPTYALFALAAADMLLIFVGIHNAWDVVTYIAVAQPADASPPSTNEHD